MAVTSPDSLVRILHLSDFHFCTRSQWDSDPVLRALARFIAEDVAQNNLYPDLVAITGDLAQSGQRKEYDLARQWLDVLWPCLSPDPARPLARDRLLLVPGNHDADWGLIESGARDAHQALLDTRNQEAITDRLKGKTTRDLLLKRHTAYLKFHGAWLGQRQTLPWWQRSLTIHGQCLHIAGLDTAWLAGGDDDSRLLLGTYQINQTVLHRDSEADCDWRIALLHHPWASLAEFDRNDAQRTLYRHRDLILRGHLHQPDLFRIVPPDPRRSCIEAAAGCCYSGKPYPNAFQWIEIYPNPRRIVFHFRCWNQDDWQVDRNQPGCPDGTHTILLPTVAGHGQIPAKPGSAGRAAKRDGLANRQPKGPLPLPNPEQPAELQRQPANLPQNATDEIEKALGFSPALCSALVKELGGDEGATPVAIARRLCSPTADFLTVLDALDKGLRTLARPPKPAPHEIEQIQKNALTVLGWVSVATVADGYEQEDAQLAKRWREGAAFRVPLGRGPCVEVITARWRDGKAEFGIDPGNTDHGHDDLVPAVIQEIGFDAPEHLTPHRAVDAVWGRVHQEMLRRQANEPVRGARRQDAARWLAGQVRKYKRRLRLVLDVHHPLASPEVLREIHEQLPDLLLILVDDEADEDPNVFILHPAELSAAIYDCLDAIRSLP
jgi:hypothetical protein